MCKPSTPEIPPQAVYATSTPEPMAPPKLADAPVKPQSTSARRNRKGTRQLRTDLGFASEGTGLNVSK
jgi:hypothetical protein